MKKIIFLVVIFLLAVGYISTNEMNELQASSATTYTYTLDYKGNYITTQDAYLPQTTFTNFHLDEPDDMVIYNDIVYLSDTGNKRVLLIDAITGQMIREIKKVIYQGKEISLKSPRGLYVLSNSDGIYQTNSSLLYICEEEEVYILNEDFECVRVIEKPTSVLFSNRKFNPLKVAADPGGNMYILGEGINEGIVQLSVEGEFLGYFATNEVKLSFKEQLQEWLYTDAQKDKLPSKNPPIFSNLYADKDGLLYSTTTTNIKYNYVQKHNTAGKNLFTKYPMIADSDLVDIYTASNGIIFAASRYGSIFVYTQQGEFIYRFGGGGGVSTPDISGVFKRITSIAVDDQNRIWVLDSDTGIVQTFEPTEFSNTIYQAIDAYLISDYTSSIDLWTEVLKLNQMSNLAHNNIGLNYLYSQQYELAMEHLKISNNKTAYSTAYWEVRNLWLQSNLTWMIITLVSVVAVLFVLKKVDDKKQILAPVRRVKQKIFSYSVISDFTDMFKIARHPEDGFYDLKKRRKGSLRGAIIILAIFFITYLIYITSKGFIYQYVEIMDIDFVSVIVGFFAIIFLSIICNFLVTSITDGNGTMKDIFLLLMYSLAPAIIGMLSIVILSHVMTMQEAFFLDVILIVSICWSVILVALGMMEMQGYNLKKLLVSLILTVLLLLIIILVLLILFVLSQQLIDFIQLIIEEVIRNVKG